MKVTINGPRYYKEELASGAFDLCIQSICCYNDFKIQMYNAIYANRYLPGSKGDILGLKKITYSAWMKEYGINDYYSTSLYAEVTGLLSSQREFRKWYLARIKDDLAARKRKIISLTESLTNCGRSNKRLCHMLGPGNSNGPIRAVC